MFLYEVFKLIHVLAAIAWIGGGIGFSMIVLRSIRAGSEADLIVNGRLMSWAGEKLMAPMSLLTFVSGLAATFAGGLWSSLWVVLGLAGVLSTMTIGIGVIAPRMRRMEAAFAANAPPAEIARMIRAVLKIAQFDLVVLVVIVATMVLKPTLDDVALLFVMALAVTGAAFVFLPRASKSAAGNAG